MFLLKRHISPYTGTDLLLGIFQEIEKAIQARVAYINECKSTDKWAEQAYHEVNLEEDVTIEDISALVKTDIQSFLKTVYVVSLMEEGFGQIIKNIDSIFDSVEEAEQYVEEKANADPEYEPGWFEYEVMEVDRVYFEK
ncbi:hypothetical protein QNI16_05085 [Cytophagaceae bacterium YF14B1]|uniref:Uncharacterized protein n=1 Tax=Xanthocytophaga flava TaxID=3048013 RepID=A0AAE3U4L8_9BACT|nr:hypothetical protein [Xanthocytophaga flavus]MDJ1479849.1 hypothetical protein [Xanthocytophaga flavus]